MVSMQLTMSTGQWWSYVNSWQTNWRQRLQLRPIKLGAISSGITCEKTLRSGEPLGRQRRERFRSLILPLRLNLHRAVSNLPRGRYTSIEWPSICIKRSRIQYRRPDVLPPQPCWHIPSTKHAEHVSNAEVVVKLVLHLLLRLLWRYLRSHPWMRGVLYRGNHSHVLVTVMLAEQRFWIVVCA